MSSLIVLIFIFECSTNKITEGFTAKEWVKRLNFVIWEPFEKNIFFASLNYGYSLYNLSSISAKVESPLLVIEKNKFCSYDIKSITLSFSNLIIYSL